jgi:hypothetical protein
MAFGLSTPVAKRLIGSATSSIVWSTSSSVLPNSKCWDGPGGQQSIEGNITCERTCLPRQKMIPRLPRCSHRPDADSPTKVAVRYARKSLAASLMWRLWVKLGEVCVLTARQVYAQ